MTKQQEYFLHGLFLMVTFLAGTKVGEGIVQVAGLGPNTQRDITRTEKKVIDTIKERCPVAPTTPKK